MKKYAGKDDHKAVVIGAGIIGLTSALRLAEAGYSVTIIEREKSVCADSSKANAGQLLYDRIGAMGSPGFLRSLPGAMIFPDQGISGRGLLHPKRWPWGLAFLHQCTANNWKNNTQGLLNLAALSRAAMFDIRAHYNLAFDWRKPGKLVVQKTDVALAAAALTAQYQAQFGGRHELLDRGACLEHEPALQNTTRTIAGGVYLPDAEVGDCHVFGQEIARILTQKFGAHVLYGQRALGLVQNAGRVTAIHTDQGIVTANLFVLATGKAAHELLPRRFANKKPIVGVKGVSLTYPAGQTPPELSVTDAAGKFVVMRLGNQVRVAGYALFEDGKNIRAQYVEQLAQKAKALMPSAANYTSTPDVWVGIRPQTPDDLPMIGACGADNLFVNAGHGSLGWTLALGSAEMLMQKINATIRN